MYEIIQTLCIFYNKLLDIRYFLIFIFILLPSLLISYEVLTNFDAELDKDVGKMIPKNAVKFSGRPSQVAKSAGSDGEGVMWGVLVQPRPKYIYLPEP